MSVGACVGAGLVADRADHALLAERREGGADDTTRHAMQAARVIGREGAPGRGELTDRGRRIRARDEDPLFAQPRTDPSRFLSLADEGRVQDAEAAIDQLFADLEQFAGTTPREDDVTIVIMKALA